MQQQNQNGANIESWFAVQLEVILRDSFGQRYLSTGFCIAITACLVGASWVLFHGIKIEYQFMDPKPVTGSLFALLAALFAMQSIWHQVAIWRRNRAGENIPHSMSTGKPRLRHVLPFAHDTRGMYIVERLFEPWVFLIIGGLVFWKLDQWFGGYLLFLDAMLIIATATHYRRWVNDLLDVADAPKRQKQILGNAREDAVADVSTPRNNRRGR